MFFFFFFKQKTAYEMRISDWSSDVCSSDLEASPQCIGISVSGPCYFPGAQMIRVGLPRANISDQGTGQVGFGNDRQHRSLNIGPNVHGLQRLALGNGLHARHEIAVERRCAGKAGVNEIAVKYRPAAADGIYISGEKAC